MKNKVIIIGTGFSNKQISEIMNLSEEERNESWERKGHIVSSNIGFTCKNKGEVKFTEMEVQSCLKGFNEELKEKCQEVAKLIGIDSEVLYNALINLPIEVSEELKEIQRLRNLTLKFEDLEPKFFNDEPKSKYINKPRYNYRRK